MRVYVSVDMEGLAGISHPAPTGRTDPGYAAACELMVGEANAAIEGALAAGADEVVVNDSHGKMFNLSPTALDPRARLVQGQKPFGMVEAARDGRFEVALFVGYHARAGHPRGTIAHTYSGTPLLTTLNDRPVGEATLNALYLGGLGVPVGMVSGDDALAEEVQEYLPWAEAVEVKRAVGANSADSLHPERARQLIREAASRAVERARGGALQVLHLELPVRVGIDFDTGSRADFAALMPGFERFGDAGVRFQGANPSEAYRAMLSAIRMGGLVD
ncbi:MAG: M55 family metallopeptidase [Chloroflexi bacterium]|nr:M55 family metallopeptidase [Chloroflexota bacterium]